MIELIQFYVKYLTGESLTNLACASKAYLREIENLGYGHYSPKTIETFQLSGQSLNMLTNYDGLYSKYSNAARIKLTNMEYGLLFDRVICVDIHTNIFDNIGLNWMPTLKKLSIYAYTIKIDLRVLPNLKELSCNGCKKLSIIGGAKNCKLEKYQSSHEHQCLPESSKYKFLKVVIVPNATVIYGYNAVTYLNCYRISKMGDVFDNLTILELTSTRLIELNSRQLPKLRKLIICGDSRRMLNLHGTFESLEEIYLPSSMVELNCYRGPPHPKLISRFV